MEDLDTTRVVAGSGEEILAALRRYGLAWDGDVVWQSRRIARYEKALKALHSHGLAYDCGCSRADLLRAASAPAAGDPVDGEAKVYPGTCRNGLPPGIQPRAVRFRVPPGVIAFHDLVHGHIEEDVAERTGDFVVRRADGLFAYQLAVVVDDAAQGVTQVVRGGDLLSSTARQIALQRALGFPEPRYAHLPLVLGPDGSKLGKRDGALPLPALDDDRVASTLAEALAMLGVKDVSRTTPSRMLADAVERFDVRNMPRETVGVE